MFESNFGEVSFSLRKDIWSDTSVDIACMDVDDSGRLHIINKA